MPNPLQGLTGPKGQTHATLKGKFPDVTYLPLPPTEGDAYLIGEDMHIGLNGAWVNMGSLSGTVGPVGVTGRVFHKVFMTFPNRNFCVVDLDEDMLDAFVCPMFPTVDEVALFSMNYPRKSEKLVALCPTDRAFEAPISQDFINLRSNYMKSLTENTVALFAKGMLAKEHSDFFHDAANPTVEEWEMLLFTYPDLKDICYKAAQAAGPRDYVSWQKFLKVTGREVSFNPATLRNEAINTAMEEL